jgi:SAM-dependent methyltransferase
MTEPAAASVPRGQRGISEALREFTAEFPFERGPILDFVLGVARGTPTDASVLDLGAGNAPYRELFAHTRYQTSDWSQSLHSGALEADIIAPADALPVADALFDLVLCTQVLEHVSEPSRVLDECRRVLVAGGRLAITVPLLWELHEQPHDYYRYTGAGLHHLLEKSGFQEIEIEPRSDGFSAVAQLMRNLGWGMGDADDGLTAHRIEARRLLQELADQFSMLAELDANRTMPLGYTALAVKPVSGAHAE